MTYSHQSGLDILVQLLVATPTTYHCLAFSPKIFRHVAPINRALEAFGLAFTQAERQPIEDDYNGATLQVWK